MGSLWIYLSVVNVVAFALYGIDKYKAKAGAWRIPEKTLLGVAVLGGSVGALAGMKFFHHKTKHKLFRYGLPIILALQMAALYWLTVRAA